VSIQLGENVKAKYSPRERDLFKILRRGRLDTKEISRRLYGKEDIPLNSRQIVLGGLDTLRKKVAVNREPFRIASTERSGPNPIEFWIEEK
jgi:hypothetical protein